MLLENFIISNVIFARQAIFSTHTEVFGVYCMACRVKILWNFFKMYPGNVLEIGVAGFVDTLNCVQCCSIAAT